MEHIKLYNHREKYIQTDLSKPIMSGFDEELLEKFWTYATQRMNIWYQKTSGNPFPWSDNPVLNQYKFCNVYRELDRQTIYIHKKLKPIESDFHLWLTNLMIFRFVANISTYEKIGIFDYTQNIESIFNDIQGTKFGDAYLFPPQIPIMLGYKDRVDFISNYLPKISGDICKIIGSFDNESVFNGVKIITQNLKIGLKFHFTEILIDVAYQYPQYINLNKKFPIGPGSMPTMKMFCKQESPENICLKLMQTQPENFPFLKINGKIMPISAEGIEGLGCEFRKYTNLQAGSGKKRYYKNCLPGFV